MIEAGDEIRTGLLLSHGLWHVTLDDATSGRSARFTTHQEAHAEFSQAEWLQEDLAPLKSHTVGIYPSTSTVEFRDVKVNSGTPRAVFMSAGALSAHGTYLAPTAFRDDAFALRPARIPRNHAFAPH